jgi:sugar lactone lactonase YvrE
VPTWTTRSLGADFTVTRYDTATRHRTGSGLDVTFASNGDIWEVGEFGTAAAQVAGGVLTEHAAPLHRRFNGTTGRYEPTKPFRSNFGAHPPTEVSGLVERVIDTGTAIWWVQGGGHVDTGNHSRLIRFDRTGTDDPATADDDRLCAVHVPGDMNHAVGLAYDPATDRVWFSEAARPGRPAAVGWFLDAQAPCSNDLDYQDPAALAAVDAAMTCSSPADTQCIHRIDLPASAGLPGHLAVDADDGYLWIVSIVGDVLSRLPLAGGTVESFPLPMPVRGGFFRGFPWQIRVDDDAVYLNEYSDNQLLRFDKAAPPSTCSTLVSGATPCISELFLPMANPEDNAHSIALRDGRLWFTMTSESRSPLDPTGSYVGYVDTASWAAGAPTGVIYDDLAALGPPPERHHWSVRGIEVDDDGRVALAEMGRAILLLTPR